MKNQKQTIRRIVGFLNNEDEDGGFWLPNIQRPFVWGEEQICRLFDSILREYPISTLLVWKTKSEIRHRRFIQDYLPTVHFTSFYRPTNDKRKALVLDGQQRLQALFIGLKGSYDRKELYLDILSGEVAAPDDIKYKFKFFVPAQGAFPWIKFKDLVFTSLNKRQITEAILASRQKQAEDLAHASGRPRQELPALPTSEANKIEDHLDQIDRTFKMDESITYQELDSIDNPALYTEDDVVEVFIRANSGGTKLGKSDLLFALLSSSWEVADEKMENLIQILNRPGYAFDRDFVLKTALVLLHQGSRYEVAKFRRPGVREEVEEKWDKISASIKVVADFVREKTWMRCGKALPTYLLLIPLVYVRYHFPDKWKEAKNLDLYLLRSALAGAFSGSPDNLLDSLKKEIDVDEGFDLDSVFETIRSQGRSLELTEDRFWQMGYGSDTIHLIFNLWYRGFNYTPSFPNNFPQVDHVFPQSLLKKIKAENPLTKRKDLQRYKEAERNQLANCMLLTMEENGAGGKSDQTPEEWFADKDDAYFERHLIPKDRTLLRLDRFEDFIAERKKIIREKFKDLLVPIKAPAVKSD